MKNVAIIGAGLIGRKRADALKKISGFKLTHIFDLNRAATKSFIESYPSKEAESIESIIENPDIDLVILAIRHKDAAILAPKILKKKNLLIEKPSGRNLKEAQKIVDTASQNKTQLFVGFNYPFYPHIQLVHHYLQKGLIGDVISSKFVIGHAAFPGYEKTWKMDKDLCGGGIILDPGVHMLDLMIHFFGYPKTFHIAANKEGWHSEVEDEASIIFEYPKKIFSMHHYSLNFAKNKMEIEIVGTKGTVTASGRGGNYDTMKFEFIPRWHWKTKKPIIVKKFKDEDTSFYEELVSYKKILNQKKSFTQNYSYFLQTMKLFDALNKSL